MQSERIGFIDIKTSEKWAKDFQVSPFLIPVKNESIFENQVKFLREINCSKIFVLVDSLDLVDTKFLNERFLWGVNVEYIEEKNRLDKKMFEATHRDKILNKQYVYIQGLLLFGANSIQNLVKSDDIFITEEKPSHGAKYINNLSRLFEAACCEPHLNEIECRLLSTKSFNLYSGRHIYISDNVELSENCQIGDNCLIGKDVSILGQTILSESCCIGEGTSLNNCLVMPGTVISAGLKFEDCIITDTTVFAKAKNCLLGFSSDNLSTKRSYS